MTCPHSQKPCINKHLCEWCRVPAAYGWFMETDRRGKVGWVQKWIREADRAAIIAHYQAEIARIERAIEALKLMPGGKNG